MSNLEKACTLTGEWIDSMGGLENVSYLYGDNISFLMLVLNDAGLLAPDLPEANDPGIFVPDGKGWRMGDISVWTAPDSPVMIQNVEPGDLSPTDTRELAHALLAAADYAEKERGNE